MIEKEGFNWQKNSGMRLEHVYRIDPDKLKVYSLWLQMAPPAVVAEVQRKLVASADRGVGSVGAGLVWQLGKCGQALAGEPAELVLARGKLRGREERRHRLG
jgi:hypothetical protein